MFTTTAFLEVESQYRGEQLRRAWGGTSLLRLRRRHWAAAARRAHRPTHRSVAVDRNRAVAGAR